MPVSCSKWAIINKPRRDKIISKKGIIADKSFCLIRRPNTSSNEKCNGARNNDNLPEKVSRV